MTVATLNLIRSQIRAAMLIVCALTVTDYYYSANFSPVTLFHVLVYAIGVFGIVDPVIERRVHTKRQEVARAVSDD